MPDLKAPSGLVWSYELKGSGEPLLFVHGWGCSQKVWKQQSEYFSRNFKVLTVDLPGHGKSSWAKVSLEDMANDLDGLTNELGLKQLNIVGSSLGGLVILKLLALHPAKIKRLILVGTLPQFLQTKDSPHGLELDRIRSLSNLLETDYPAIVQIFFRSLFTGQERRSARYQWLQQFGPKEEVPQKEALKTFLEFLQAEDLSDTLRKINFPVQFINGTEDYICTADSIRALQKTVAGSRLELFKGCGHFPFLTKPVEFNRVLEKFLITK